MAIEFTIPCEPVPWSAPKLSRRGVYSTHSAAKAKMRALVKYLYKGPCFDEPVNCSLYFYVPIPSSTPDRKRSLMLEGRIRPGKRPDRTNFSKLAEDAIEGIAYVNDSLIVGGAVEKWYSDNPRIVVKIDLA